MIYDEYFDLAGMDLAELICPQEEMKAVYRVVYPVMNREKSYLDLWIHSEKDGFYLYLVIYTKEPILFGYGFSELDARKVLLLEKHGRGTAKTYYEAGIKAALFAKDMVRQFFPEWEVNWKPVAMYDNPMTKMPHYICYCETQKETYVFDEAKLRKRIY